MKKIFLLAAVTLALTACDKNDGEMVPASGAVRITATIGESVVTRASDSSWAEGDNIGITATVGNGVKKYVNLKYSYSDDGTFSGDTDIYFYKPMSLTAYYPFAGTEGTYQAVIEASTAAELQTEEMQPSFDFLYAEPTGIDVSGDEPKVNFNFTHKMGKLTLIFKDGDQTEVSDIVKYQIDGLVLNGTFNTETGVCAVDGDAAAAPLAMEFEQGDVESEKALSPLILFPQTLNGGSVKLHVYTDEYGSPQHYTCLLSFSDGEIKAGCNYVYTITVNKAGLKVDASNIDKWTVVEPEESAKSED